jgi:hypothetical protein
MAEAALQTCCACSRGQGPYPMKGSAFQVVPAPLLRFGRSAVLKREAVYSFVNFSRECYPSAHPSVLVTVS